MSPTPTPRQKSALTALFVHKTGRVGKHYDNRGHGLYLSVSDTGSKRWEQRITFNSRCRNLGLGRYPDVSLREARKRALRNRQLVGVDPNSWTPDPLGRRYPPCRDQDRRTRRSSGARWLSWCEPDGVRKSCHESSSRRRRRSATGSCKASVTRGVAGMGQAPRSERSCVAFAERIVGCAKNEISWQKPRPGLLGGPYRGGLPVHESESGRVSNRHDGPSARSLPERVLRVAHP